MVLGEALWLDDRIGGGGDDTSAAKLIRPVCGQVCNCRQCEMPC